MTAEPAGTATIEVFPDLKKFDARLLRLRGLLADVAAALDAYLEEETT